jgi:hypothetical protein
MLEDRQGVSALNVEGEILQDDGVPESVNGVKDGGME